MALARKLFRESALERLSSPEQLDSLLQITSPRGWVALVSLWLLLGAVVVWAILGTVATNEPGQGIIVPPEGFNVVEAQSAGRLSKITPGVGDHVDRGDIVAWIDRRDLTDQLEEKQARLRALRDQDILLTGLDAEEAARESELAVKEREGLDRKITHLAERARRLQTQVDALDALIAQNAGNEMEKHEIEEARELAQIDGEQAQHDLVQVGVRTMISEFKRKREADNRRLEILELEEQIKTLDSRVKRDTTIESDFTGYVVELRASAHSVVEVGDPILVIKPAQDQDDALEAVLYVSAATSRNIEIGDEVEIAPSNVKREEFGAILGTVLAVTEGATSREAMMTTLTDTDLVQTYMTTIGPPRTVRVKLEVDPETVSGFAWTSREGPPFQIASGTLCTGLISVEERRPIELVIPAIRKAAGVD